MPFNDFITGYHGNFFSCLFQSALMVYVDDGSTKGESCFSLFITYIAIYFYLFIQLWSTCNM